MHDVAAFPATGVETVPGTDLSREWLVTNGLGGYGGGLPLKRRLLELEGALPRSLDLGSL